MIAVDTNVLIRVVVDDPGQLQQAARARKQAKTAG
jgi:predicted nucleic acid-binding protein